MNDNSSQLLADLKVSTQNLRIEIIKELKKSVLSMVKWLFVIFYLIPFVLALVYWIFLKGG